MLKRLLVAVLLLGAVSSARPKDFTDVYWVGPAEDGWGFFLVQSDTTQFLAFFIYGPDGKPTWYVAVLQDDGTGKSYAGAVYATTGTYFPLPWNPALHAAVQAGTATFQPSDPYHATLTYTISGIGTVTKTVQRQTLAPYVLGGNYSGSMSGAITGCTDPSNNIPQFLGRYDLNVTQNGDSSASLTFTFVDAVNSGLVCTASGPLTHLGRLYQLNGQLTCTNPAGSSSAPVIIDQLHPTGQGVEGKVTGSYNGCAAVLRFAAVVN